MNLTESDKKKLNELIKNLEFFRTELVNIDYIHKKKEFFNIMVKLRKYLLSVEDGKIFNFFFHSKYYKFYNEYFTNINQYYLRSLEAIQSLSIMTK